MSLNKERFSRDAYSGRKRPVISEQSGHLFRLIPATLFELPESDQGEATLDNFKRISHHFPSENERRKRWPERGYPCEKFEKYSD